MKTLFTVIFLFVASTLCAQWNLNKYGYGSKSGSTITMIDSSFKFYLTNGQQITAHIYSQTATDSEEIALITWTKSTNSFAVNSVTQNYYGGTSAVSFPDSAVVVRYTYPIFWTDGGTGQRIAYAGRMVSVPSHSNSTGSTGDVAYDPTYFYFCIATNIWVKIAWTSSSW